MFEEIVHVILLSIFRMLNKELTDKSFQAFMQFIKFGIIGVSNTVISYLVYLLCLLLFRRLGILPNSGYLAAQAVGFVISIVWSFYWNNKVVFTLQEDEERSALRTFVKTFISYSFTGLVLNSVLLVVWVRILSISEFIAPIINLLISVPLNFIINKFWAFRRM